jgi:hypothetical protein
MNCSPKPPTVSFACSSGVSTTPGGTSGFTATVGSSLESGSSEKSPVQNVGCGRLLVLTCTGERFQFLSYAAKNQVLLNFGIGPPNDPPISVKLKYGLGYVL